MTAVASLVGVGVYNSYLKEVPLRRIFLWTTVLGTGLGLTQVTPNSYLFVPFPSQMAQDLA